jgi:hypothetical protein
MAQLCHAIRIIASIFCDTCASQKSDTSASAWCTIWRMNRAQAHMRRLHSLGWTIAAISRASSRSRSTLYRVEQGADVSLPTIKAILAVRGYPPARPGKGEME